jgi:hypothetical protein
MDFIKKTGSTILKEWTTPDCRNTASTTNLEEEETVDDPGNDGKALMPEQVKRPNPWRKMMMINSETMTSSCMTQYAISCTTTASCIKYNI